jgi:hypothetical protein
MVAEDHIYGDDAVSGAEIRKLVNRQRLLDVVSSGRTPFQVLIMRDSSRFSRRDGDEAFAEFKRLTQRGIDVWFYQDAERLKFVDFASNITGIVRAEMNAEYRRQIAKYTKEAMVRKAKACHVTGGPVLRLRQRLLAVPPRDSAGDDAVLPGRPHRKAGQRGARRGDSAHLGALQGRPRLHADRQAAERGRRTNAHRAPESTVSWSPGSIREVLKRDLYRGEVVYNKSRRRAPAGSTTFAPRPETEWMRLTREDLRIVTDGAWRDLHARIDDAQAQLMKAGGGFTTRGKRRRKDADSPYPLSGFTRCAQCGNAIDVFDKRAYACTAYHKRGTTVCTNALRKPSPRSMMPCA